MSKTSLVAKQVRLQQWAADVRSCNERPKGITVEQWCTQHGLNKATYYWRLGAVRRACLDIVDEDICETNDFDNGFQTTFTELNPVASAPDTCVPALLKLGNATVEISEGITDGFLLRLMEAAYHVK